MRELVQHGSDHQRLQQLFTAARLPAADVANSSAETAGNNTRDSEVVTLRKEQYRKHYDLSTLLNESHLEIEFRSMSQESVWGASGLRAANAAAAWRP